MADPTPKHCQWAECEQAPIYCGYHSLRWYIYCEAYLPPSGIQKARADSREAAVLAERERFEKRVAEIQHERPVYMVESWERGYDEACSKIAAAIREDPESDDLIQQRLERLRRNAVSGQEWGETTDE